MIDIDGLIELFGEMQKSGIENLRVVMNDKDGMKFSLVITPPEKCVCIPPESYMTPEKAPEAAEEKAQEPEKKTISNEELKSAIEAAVGKTKRGGRPRKDKTTDQILDDMARSGENCDRSRETDD